MDARDKAVLITGGTRGIGKATAKAFHDLGARVAVNGRTGESVERAIAELGGGDRLAAAPGDVGTVAACENVVKAALDVFGALDVLVNSAGVFHESSITKSDEAMWDETIDVNLKGTFFCSRAALPALRASKGAIVNIGSEAGLIGFRECAVYCASKGGVVNLTRAMAIEVAPEVRVNCVCPGPVDTDMMRASAEESGDPEAYFRETRAYVPIGRIATPEEIAQAILYLASDDARFVTGAALAIEGGSTAGR